MAKVVRMLEAAGEIGSPAGPRWWLLRVRCNCEKEVANALARKGFESYVPTHWVTRQWSDRTKRLEKPLFPGCLFCRYAPHEGLAVVATRHVLSGFGSESHPLPVSEVEIADLRSLLGAGFQVNPWRYVSAGYAVRVNHDSLRDCRGVLAQHEGSVLFVMNIDSLRSSVAAVVPRELLLPA
jgi:transcription termination/antitermination protein NusG